MQIYKDISTVYSDTIISRPTYYTSTTFENVKSSTLVVNQEIAGALSSIGVNSSYTRKSNDEYEWLYINDMPLFITIDDSSEVYINLPQGTILVLTTIFPVSKFISNGLIKFSILFQGNPNGSFSLRFGDINRNLENPSMYLLFIKLKNMYTNNNAFIVSSMSFTVDCVSNAPIYIIEKIEDKFTLNSDNSRNRSIVIKKLNLSNILTYLNGNIPFYPCIFNDMYIADDLYYYIPDSTMPVLPSYRALDFPEYKFGDYKFMISPSLGLCKLNSEEGDN